MKVSFRYVWLLIFCWIPLNICKPSFVFDVGDRCQLSSSEDVADGDVCTLLSSCPSAKFAQYYRGIHPITCLFTAAGRAVCCDPRRKSIQACDAYFNLKLRPSYVLKGSLVMRKRYPHMAALGYLFPGSDIYRYYCGGSLISEQFVLTAAHCINTRQGKLTVVRMGEIDLDLSPKEGSLHTIAGTFVHERYNSKTVYNDIGLIKLSSPAQLHLSVYPACLYSEPTPPETLTVVGWGAVDSGGFVSSPNLLEADLSFRDLQYCSRHYVNNSRVPDGLDDRVVCASDTDRERDTCSGDSGGPIQTTSFHGSRSDMSAIVGVTSYGSLPCGGVRPGLYTNVYHYLDWIEDRVWPSKQLYCHSHTK